MLRTCDRIVTIAVVLVAFVLPFEEHTSGAITFGTIIAVVGFLCGMAIRRQWAWPRTRADAWIVAYFGVCLAASLLSIDREASLDILFKRLLVALVLFYLVAAHFADRSRIRLLIGSLLVAGTIVVTYSLFTYFARSDLRIVETGRAFGTFRQPNRLAQYLLILIGLTIACIGAARGVRPRIALGALLVAAISTLFVTYSRAGWLALPVTAGVFVARGSRRMLTVVLLVVLALGVGILVTPRGRGRITNDVLGGERLLIYRSAISAFADNPVLGLGYGDRTVLKAYGDRYRLPEARDLHSGTHNIFLQAAVETGGLGLLAFVGLHGSLFLTMMHFYRRCSDASLKWVLLWGPSVIVAFFTIGQLHTLYRERNLLLFWVAMGASFAMGKLAETEVPRERRATTVQNDQELTV